MRRPYFLLPAVAFIAALTGCLLCGCLAIDPGGQSARSLKQWSEVTWTETGALVVKTHGPQTASWEMASGGTIVLAAGEDGNPVIDPGASAPDYWFRSYPSADVAGAVAPVAFENSTAQVAELMRPLADIVLRFVEAFENLALKPVPEGDGDGG